MKRLALLFLILNYLPSIANDLENYPENWFGNISHFESQAEGLQLSGDDSGESEIYKYFYPSPHFILSTSFSLNYSPSSNNQFKFVIWSEDTSLANSNNTLYLEIGQSGSEDVFKLKEIINNNSNTIATSDSFFPNGGSNINLNIEYRNDSLFVNINEETEIQIPHTISNDHGYYGVKCKYTSSNSSNTQLHQLSHSSLLEDLEGPNTESVSWISNQELEIIFDETIDSIEISSGFIDIVSYGFSENKANILFNDTLIDNQEIEFWINVWDPLRNHSSFEYTVIFDVSKQFDLVFNEFMIDPSPSLGFYDDEYIEIYNNSGKSIDLDKHKLVLNDDTIALGYFTIEPDSFMIISDISLNNSSFHIKLLNEVFETIDYFEYNHELFDHMEHSSGGWSLERKDPNSYVKSTILWSFNRSMLGGSPGKVNTNLHYIEDVELPYINMITIENGKVQYIFNEPVKSETSFYTNTSFDLDNISDYAGNLLLDTSFNLNPVSIEESDLKISEVMFNANSETPEFIEISNTSGKTLIIQHLFLAKKVGSEIIPIYTLPKGKVIQNHEIFTLTASKYLLEKHIHSNEITIINDPSFPDLLSSEMNLLLINEKEEIIDEIIYKQKWHHPDFKNEKGISLERINLNSSGLDSLNWMSSSFEVNYATPSRANAQAESGTEEKESLYLENQVLNYSEPLILNYSGLKPGSTLSLFLYNDNGKFICPYSSTILVDSQGKIRLNDWENTSYFETSDYILLIKFSQGNKEGRKKLGFMVY